MTPYYVKVYIDVLNTLIVTVVLYVFKRNCNLAVTVKEPDIIKLFLNFSKMNTLFKQ